MLDYRSQSDPGRESEKQVSYEILSDPEARENIRERMGRFLRAVHDRRVDTLVFLDRSARPLSWMFRAMWKRNYPSEAVPDVKFLNIGTATETHGGQSGELPWDDEVAESFDRRQERVWESASRDRWLSPAEIPASWQRVISEKTEWMHTLRETFQDSFAGRYSVIVEELGCSGKTQMMALGVLNGAFPSARKFEAATFFQSRSRGPGDESIDKEQLPWFRELGMAGVLEIPDIDAIQSASLSAENVRRIRSELEGRIERLEKEGVALVPAGLAGIARWEALMRETFVEDPPLCERLAVIIGRWKEMHEACMADGTIRPYDIEAVSLIRGEIYEAVRASEKYGNDWGAIRRMGDALRDIEEGPYGCASQVRKLRAAIDAHADLPSLIARSKQLRREMEELAKGRG